MERPLDTGPARQRRRLLRAVGRGPQVVVRDGSSTVMINGRPAARLKSRLTCGACIKTGSPNVVIGVFGSTRHLRGHWRDRLCGHADGRREPAILGLLQARIALQTGAICGPACFQQNLPLIRSVTGVSPSKRRPVLATGAASLNAAARSDSGAA